MCLVSPSPGLPSLDCNLLHIVRHNFGDKKVDGAHGLRMAQTTPLERTDEVIRPRSHIFIHVQADRVRRPSHDAKPGATSITAQPSRIGATSPLFFRAFWRLILCVGRLTVW